MGVSNFDIDQVDYILKNCRIKPINNQIEFHPYLDQSEILTHHKSYDISVTSFMTLGRGDRTKNAQGVNLFNNDVIKQISENHKVSTPQVLLRYMLQRGVLVVPKRTVVKNFKLLKILNYFLKFPYSYWKGKNKILSLDFLKIS